MFYEARSSVGSDPATSACIVGHDCWGVAPRDTARLS